MLNSHTSSSDKEVCFSGGEVTLGSTDYYPEEKPLRTKIIKPFCIDKYEVSVADFSKFVKATNYLSLAETGPSRNDYPNQADEFFQPGSAVFEFPNKNQQGKWTFNTKAYWLNPQGTEMSQVNSELHPVVHVALVDARAYANWKNRRLPTEAEWEYATTQGKNEVSATQLANTWDGFFPIVNTKKDGYIGTSPVGSYTPDENGIYDLLGNVWEWTDDRYGSDKVKRYVIKGGSHLCAANYCSRYRATARQGQEAGLGTSHIGFRTVRDMH